MDILKDYHIEKISDSIKGYFKYYAGRYEFLKGSKRDIIEIPVMDGCRSLDNCFINVLCDNGWEYRYNALLGTIFLIYEKGV